jgi:VanZ family protein
VSNKGRGWVFWLRAWLPVFLGVGIIALESTNLFSAQETYAPLRVLYQALFGPVGDSDWAQIHLYIRKSGHFLGYGLLALTWLRAWWMTLPKSVFLTDALLALLGTAMTASADELHQAFLPGRTGTPWDVLIDCSGAITLQLVVYVCMRIFRPKRLSRPAQKSPVQPCEPAPQRTPQ